MITIFGEFGQFSAKKLAFFSKEKQCCDQFFQNLALFRVQNAIFSLNFSAKIFKNHNIGPWPP
jgi:hypothetical protein